jgi:MoxR-like ATPase|tara:strand:- start:2262 stop:3455 length:1194 start_codon:yes stop_codon:yes gene_type:complete
MDALELAGNGIEKMSKLREEMEVFFLEQSRVIRMANAATIGEFNFCLIGGVGIAKSMIVESWFRSIDGSKFMLKLMNKNMSYEELFGPVNMDELMAGRMTRNVEGFLPAVHYFFKDEIFKTSPMMLNPSLRVVNEKKFTNGNVEIDCPLRVLVGASNEKPSTEAFRAFWSRMLGRIEVKGIADKNNYLELLSRDGSRPNFDHVGLTLEEVDAVSKVRGLVVVPSEIKEAMWNIRGKLKEAGIDSLDDRKSVWVVNKLLKSEALMSGSPEVGPEHLGILVDALWENLGEQATVSNIVSDIVGSGDDVECKKLLVQAQEIAITSQDKYHELVPHRWVDYLEASADYRQAMVNIKCSMESIRSMSIGERKVYASECLAEIVSKIGQMDALMNDAKIEGGN